MTPRAPLEAGFTLLEVLVAFTILSIAVVASIQGFAQGLRLLKHGGDHQQAVLLADQKIREVVNPANEKEHEQDVEGAFTWERTITVDPTPELASSRATERWRVYRITVKVGWGDRRQVEIATLRTSAEKAETPGAKK